MFTRTELEVRSIPELRNLCRRYGVNVVGASGKAGYIALLQSFPQIALQQLRASKRLKLPNLTCMETLATVLSEIGEPTNQQISLIRISLEGRRMSYPDRFDQEKLLAIYKARMEIERAIALLNQ
ncbi:hypothetical protein [Calothrix sp. PCC 7507]|uniref:hypothetical protein n=1 Tax=Calothrix sp. PCC 7507 TaxID=99598 RepID=UPI00029ED960|nr:hypothetical protein [Calothrix sp. PCC 7507]AFY31504.1 hypothetical protein Cal7507_1027 [Calothrix sp. PCC 7507]